MAPGKFKVKFVAGKPVIETETSNQSKEKLEGKLEFIGPTIKYIPDNVDEKFDSFFDIFVKKINGMCLTKKNTDKVFI